MEVSRDALCAMGMALVIPKPLPHFALDHVIGHGGILGGRTVRTRLLLSRRLHVPHLVAGLLVREAQA